MRKNNWIALALIVEALCVLLLIGAAVSAQAPPAAAAPPPAEAHAPAVNPCLLVKHKGTIGRRLLWTALIGIPIAPGAKYDYIDSIDYKNSKLAYGGKDLLKIQAAGVHVIILENKYSAVDLDSARRACAAQPTK